MNSRIIGITGRSGSGKSTLVKYLLKYYGPEHVTLHTMDNYYLPRDMQIKDTEDYLNFDLPTSFYRDRFHLDLDSLSAGQVVRLEEYQFNNKDNAKVLTIDPAPIILVEGLFVFHYSHVADRLDLKVLVDISYEEAFRRRMIRDQKERNYTPEEIAYRYTHHVEPSYQKFIQPYEKTVDLLIDNSVDMTQELDELHRYIDQHLALKKENQ